MKIQAIALAVTTSLCAFGLQAADLTGKSYLVGSIGSAKVDLDEAKEYYDNEAALYRSFGGVTASVKVDDKDTAYTLGAGHWFNEYLAVEGFYRNYGEVTAGVRATDGFDTVNENDEFSASGLGLGLLGFLPVSNSFSLYARLDLVNLKAEAKSRYSATWGDQYSAKNDDTNMKTGLGLGGQFNFGAFAIRGDYQRIEAELEDFETDIDSFNLSILTLF